MGIGAGEWDLDISIHDDPAREQRSKEIFVLLALGLVGIRDEYAATRLTAIFEDITTSEQQRSAAIDELRTRIIDFNTVPGLRLPPLGNVLDRANTLADMEDQSAVPNIIYQYLEKHQASDPLFVTGRRTPAAVVATEVA